MDFSLLLKAPVEEQRTSVSPGPLNQILMAFMRGHLPAGPPRPQRGLQGILAMFGACTANLWTGVSKLSSRGHIWPTSCFCDMVGGKKKIKRFPTYENDMDFRLQGPEMERYWHMAWPIHFWVVWGPFCPALAQLTSFNILHGGRAQ